MVEYTNFRIAALEMRRSASLMFHMLLSKKISVLMFWMSHGDTWPTLQVLDLEFGGFVRRIGAEFLYVRIYSYKAKELSQRGLCRKVGLC